MSVTPSNDFRILIDPGTGVPFYKQIILQVEMAMADGRLKAGAQLPTVRGLAVELSVNPNTVVRAYNELEIRGLVTTQQGSGTYISEHKVELSEVEREQVLANLVTGFLGQASAYGFTSADLIEYLQQSNSNGGRGE